MELGRLLFSVFLFTAYKRYSCTGQIITPHESSNMRILLLQRAERRDLDKSGNANGRRCETEPGRNFNFRALAWVHLF